jgi:hypothetical protein
MLKSCRTLFVTTALFLIAFVQASLAQPLCDDGQCSWIGPFKDTYDVSGCIVQLTWYYRICNGAQEFQVTAIKKFNACTVDGWQLFAGAELALLEDNPMVFDPSVDGQCRNNVRASRASCFRPNTLTGELESCGEYNCCRIEYKLCLVGTEYKAEQTGDVAVTDNCDHVIEGCRFVCPPH